MGGGRWRGRQGLYEGLAFPWGSPGWEGARERRPVPGSSPGLLLDPDLRLCLTRLHRSNHPHCPPHRQRILLKAQKRMATISKGPHRDSCGMEGGGYSFPLDRSETQGRELEDTLHGLTTIRLLQRLPFFPLGFSDIRHHACLAQEPSGAAHCPAFRKNPCSLVQPHCL